MITVTITEILDDLRAADEITRRYGRRYWLSSADFFFFLSYMLRACWMMENIPRISLSGQRSTRSSWTGRGIFSGFHVNACG